MVAVPRIPSAVTALMGKQAYFQLPCHLYHFTRRGIRQLLERSGFCIIMMKSKSNSILCQSLSRWLGKEQWANHPAMRAFCILFEMFFDMLGVGASIEVHARAGVRQ